MSFCLTFFYNPSVTGWTGDGSKQILNFFSSVSLPEDYFSNLGSLSFEAFLLWKSIPVKFSTELSHLKLKQVFLLPMKLEISFLCLNHRKIKTVLTNLRIIRCKKKYISSIFNDRHIIILGKDDFSGPRKNFIYVALIERWVFKVS